MPPTTTPPDWFWTGYSFRAMNTHIQTWLYSQTALAPDILVDVQQLFNSMERSLSRFKADSDLSRFNQCNDEQYLARPTLLSALEVALLAAQMTNGLYDPTILPALEQAGYDRSFEQITPQTASHTQTNVSKNYDFRSIEIDRPRRLIHKPVGLRVDLGGMGKGWTVDRATDRLQGLGPFMVNAGGDIFAYHSPPGTKGWLIELVHPFQPEISFATLCLHHRALATSTIAKRQWQRNGQIMHHLIDPRTRQPAQTDAVSVSVVAERTVLAEIYAKVALILGAEQGLAYLESLPNVEGLIFTAKEEVIYTTGMAAWVA